MDVIEPTAGIDQADSSESVPINNEEAVPTDPPMLLSKRQLKKRKKMELLMEKRKLMRIERRAKQKEKRKEGRQMGRKQTRAYVTSMSQSKCRIRIAVDMAFDHLMDQLTVKKAVSQLAHCYAANRRLSDPMQFFIINVAEKTKKVFDEIEGSRNWDVHIMYQSLSNLWDANEIVYLTADSENVLETLEESKVYVIGGLLDHNHHKGTCLKKAQEEGFAHARLPIENFFKLSGRKVLTINQVFEILTQFTCNKDWEKAFLEVIPKRKGLERVNASADESHSSVEKIVEM